MVVIVGKEGSQALEDASQARSFDELAASQGVRPVVDFDALIAHSSAEDESVEAFAAMLREWRSEGSAASPQ